MRFQYVYERLFVQDMDLAVHRLCAQFGSAGRSRRCGDHAGKIVNGVAIWRTGRRGREGFGVLEERNKYQTVQLMEY